MALLRVFAADAVPPPDKNVIKITIYPNGLSQGVQVLVVTRKNGLLHLFVEKREGLSA